MHMHTKATYGTARQANTYKRVRIRTHSGAPVPSIITSNSPGRLSSGRCAILSLYIHVTSSRCMHVQHDSNRYIVCYIIMYNIAFIAAVNVYLLYNTFARQSNYQQNYQIICQNYYYFIYACAWLEIIKLFLLSLFYTLSIILSKLLL